MSAVPGTLTIVETVALKQAAPFVSKRFFLLIAGLSLGIVNIANAQDSNGQHSAESAMKEHYNAAFLLQDKGKIVQADLEHKSFLATALHRLANGYANLGEYAQANPLYAEAIRLSPDDNTVQMDYAGASLDAGDWNKAKLLATTVLDLLKKDGHAPSGSAVSLLAQALLASGEYKEALEEFKIAAEIQHDFKSSYALAGAELLVGDKSSAANIIRELPVRFGDTPSLHMQLGRLYGQTQLFDEAIEEFKKAIALDGQLPGAHYSLGATYMMQSGEPGYATAEAEFRKEIALYPNDSLVYSPLGTIAMSQHNYAEAEGYLKRAVQLAPMNTGAYLVLGQLYSTMGRIPEAEAAFRKAIAATLDPAKNDYEVERAHFWLGRLLLQNGNPAEGRKELDTSRDLLYFKAKQTELKLHGSRIIQSPLDKTHQAHLEDLTQLKEFESKVGPLIASSYNNLGVHAAIAGDYASAATYFAHAAQWNPALNGVDMNWGRAAFAARKYADAVEPLERTLALQPGNEDVRSMLGISYYMTHDYSSTLRVLQPIEGKINLSPILTLAYDGATALAGDYRLGLARLQAIESTHPESPIVHCLLGEAFAIKGDYDHSAEELHTALRLDEANADAKYALSLTEKALGEKGEAQKLLTELANSGSSDGAVFYQLGLLQMDAGVYKDAAANLETAIHLSPKNGGYHRELANAYSRDGRPDDADHEAQQAEFLQVQGGADANQQSRSQEGSMSSDKTATIQKESSRKGVDNSQ